MNHLFHGFVERYFANHLSRPLKELYASAAILTFATAAITIFEPIYLWRVGFSLTAIFLFYAAVYVGYLLALPLGAKAARAWGYEHAMFVSSPFLIIYYLSLFAIPYNRVFVAVAVLAYILQKIFYWPAYHADFARFGNHAERGRELTTMGLLLTVAGLTGPVVGGLIIGQWGFKALFLAVAGLTLFSNIPMLTTPEKFTPVAFSYGAAWRRLFGPKFKKELAGGLGYMEDLMVMVAWPLFLFSVVPAFVKVGAIVSGASLGVAALLLVIGRLTDKSSRPKMIRTGIIFTVGIWLLRSMLATPVGVFISDLWYRFSRSLVGIPMAASIYDRAKAGSVMETVVAYEMMLAGGKALAAAAGAAIVFYHPAAPWFWLFALAGAATVFYAFFIRKPSTA